MPVVYTRCCGLDVHQASVTACVLVFNGTTNDVRIKQFGTHVAELISSDVGSRVRKSVM